MAQSPTGCDAADGGIAEEVLNISTSALKAQITFSRSMLVAWADALKQLKPDTSLQVVTIREIASAEALVKKGFLMRHVCPSCSRYFDGQYIVPREVAYCTLETRATQVRRPPPAGKG